MIQNGLRYPRLRVLLIDGVELEAHPLGPDQIAFEFESVKRKWPDFQKIPVTWQTYLAWHSLRREGHIAATVTWDQFREQCSIVAPAEPAEPDQDDAETDVADAPFTDPAPDID